MLTGNRIEFKRKALLVLFTLGLIAASGVTEAIAATVSKPNAPSVPASTRSPSPVIEHVSQSGSDFIYLALVSMALATAISAATSIYLYRWRSILLRDTRLLVPEELGIWLHQTDKSFLSLKESHGEMGRYLRASVERTSSAAAATHESIDRLMQAYLTLQNALDDKDAEIKRLREGYDTQIYRRFISRFLRARQSLADAQAQQSFGPEPFEQVKRLLDDAFEDCGVERFEPSIGSDYRTTDGLADPPMTTNGARDDQAFQIAEVLEAGYRINGGGRVEVIVPARVRILVP